MGTRADFYVQDKKTREIEWLGSIAWDGYPDAISKSVLGAKTPTGFRKALKAFLSKRDDVSGPAIGGPWVWPWEDSRLTDFAYVFTPEHGVLYRDGDKYDDMREKPDDGKCSAYRRAQSGRAVRSAFYKYPCMKSLQKVSLGKDSGVMVFGIK